VHLELEPEKVEGQEEEDEMDQLNESFDSEGNVKAKKVLVFKFMADYLYQRWLFIDPSKEEVLTML
jgi:hypothetical protein